MNLDATSPPSIIVQGACGFTVNTKKKRRKKSPWSITSPRNAERKWKRCHDIPPSDIIAQGRQIHVRLIFTVGQDTHFPWRQWWAVVFATGGWLIVCVCSVLCTPYTTQSGLTYSRGTRKSSLFINYTPTYMRIQNTLYVLLAHWKSERVNCVRAAMMRWQGNDITFNLPYTHHAPSQSPSSLLEALMTDTCPCITQVYIGRKR